MHAGAVLAVPLILAGGLAQLTPGAPGNGADPPFAAQLAFERARVDGVAQMEAPTGAMLTEGAPGTWSLEGALQLTVMRMTREYADNPLGGDVFVASSDRQEQATYEAARVAILESGPRAVAYAYRDATDSPGGFVLPLGTVHGNLFGATEEGLSVQVGPPNLSFSFNHSVEGPAFGVAGAPSGSLYRAAPSLEVRGAFHVVLDNLLLRLQDADGAADVRTGEWRTDEASLGPLTPRYRTERAYAILDVREGVLRWDPPEGGGRFLAHEPLYRVDGRLFVPEARGGLEVGGVRHAAQPGAVELVGQFTVRPRADGAHAAPLQLASPSRGVHAAIDGSATEARVGGQSVLPPSLPDGVRTLGLIAVLTGLVGAAWATLQRTLAPALFPLYARLSRRELLGNRCRMALYRAIEARPFVHLRELQRATGLGFGTVAYHVSLLKRERFVASVRLPGRELFFIPRRDLPMESMRRLALLADPARKRVVEAVLRRSGATQRDLASALDMDQGLLSRQLAKLEAGGLLQRTGAGVYKRGYVPTSLLMTWARQGRAEAAAPLALAASEA